MAIISLKLYTNGFIGSVLMSPIQMGSLRVNNSVKNISRLGTFKKCFHYFVTNPGFKKIQTENLDFLNKKMNSFFTRFLYLTVNFPVHRCNIRLFLGKNNTALINLEWWWGKG
jgi:hypothetical protein